jgi:hypothetical protein
MSKKFNDLLKKKFIPAPSCSFENFEKERMALFNQPRKIPGYEPKRSMLCPLGQRSREWEKNGIPDKKD